MVYRETIETIGGSIVGRKDRDEGAIAVLSTAFCE
jgi:hypothetical protein